jgi:hypothetical protein
VQDENPGPETRRFSLPSGHVEPLIDCGSLNYMVPLAQLLVGAVRPLPAVLDAYRSGGGVPVEEYGSDLREGQAAINYPGGLYTSGQRRGMDDVWLEHPALPAGRDDG